MAQTTEVTPFLDHEESTDRFASVKKLATRAILLASVSGIAIAASNHGVSSSSSSLSSLSSEKLTNIQLELSNDYTAIHGHPATDYVWLEEGTLVEPGKVTSVKLAGIPDRYEQSSLTTSCTAVHASNGETIAGKPGDIDCELVFTKPGSFTVQTTIHHSDLGEIGSVQRDVISRYVRRDIRKLSAEDLAAYMNAARTLYDVDMDEGQGIYGPNYKSMTYFLDLHLARSIPDKHHDYMHDGMGFLTQHIAITNEYELALQVIDVSVALPYWDFTQDYSIIRKMAKDEGREIDFADLWTLDVWGEDYFGSAVGSSLHTVTEGRWAYTKVPKVVGAQGDFAGNAYGFMRAPWNVQSSPYITRYHTLCGMSIGGKDSDETNQWPNCKMHHTAVFDIDTYAEYLVYNAYTAHAGVHLMIGGAGGGTASCDDWSELSPVVGESLVKNIKFEATFAMRNVWRSDLCTEPSSEKCDGSVKDGDTSECKLVCKGCELEQFTTDQQTDLNILWTKQFEHLTDEERERASRVIFCDSKVLMGEHIEGASAVDVSFWPIHPTMERLIQYKQLVHPFTDYTWDARPYQTTWNSECKWGMQFDTDCLGHAMNDATVGKMQFLNEDSGEYETKHLTNQEILSATKPAHTSKLSYVYDNFDYTHCESEGIIFKKIPKNLQNN